MRQFISDFRDGIEAYSQAYGLIKSERLWGYVLLPGFLSILFGTGIFFLAWQYSGGIGNFLKNNYPFDFAKDEFAAVAVYAGWAIIAALAFVSYKYIILILVAPFMGPLSEKIEAHLQGRKSNARFNLIRAGRELWRGLRVSLRNLLRELVYTGILLLIGLIPLIGFVSAPAIFAIQAYFVGFGNMDYTLERHMGVKESAGFVGDYKGLAIANGSIFLLLLMIPIAGLFLAPSLATVASAVETIQRLEHEGRLA
ncbi:MAG: coproporphyrinogen III oxidase [Bacteroidetes bacterium]|nr:MAG: coproporphyrinogen III oxidase [Bacteroidota bacterium]